MGSINDIYNVFSAAVQSFIDAGMQSVEAFWDLGTGSLGSGDN